MSSGSPKTQVLNLPLDGSMDQRSHARQAQAPMVLRATNVRYPELGAVEKRRGLTSVANSFFNEGILTSLTPLRGKLISAGDELLVVDGYYVGTLFTHPTLGQTFVKKGRVPEAMSRTREVDSSQYLVLQQDTCISSLGHEFHVWCSNERTLSGLGFATPPVWNVYWTVRDQNKGGEVISQGGNNAPVSVDSWQPHIVSVGPDVVMFYTLSGTGTIVYRIWNQVSLTWGAQTNLVTDGATAGMGTQYQVCTDGTDIFLVYSRALTIRILRISATTGAILSAASSTETFPAGPPIGFGICANPGERVWVTYCLLAAVPFTTGPVTIRASAYSITLGAETTLPFTVYTTPANIQCAKTGVCRLTPTTACVLIDAFTSTGGNDARDCHMSAPVISSTGAIVGSASPDTRKAFWCIPASTPFVASTSPLRVYAWCHVGGAFLGTLASGTFPPRPPVQSLQWTMMLVDLRADDTTLLNPIMRPVTWQTPRYSLPSILTTAHTLTTGHTAFTVSHAVQAPSSKWFSDAIVRKNNVSRVTLATYEADSNSPDMYLSASIGKTALMTPGWYWDRRQMAEIGFSHWPQMVAAVPSATGGNLINAKQYAYRVIYEFVDGTGAVHRSKPSDPLFVTIPGAGTAGSVVVTIPNLHITARQGDVQATFPTAPIRIVLYRAGPLDGADQSYYRVQADRDLRINALATGVVTITDTAADFETPGLAPNLYKQRDTLYTAGGIVDNVMPPSFTSIATYHNRACISYGNSMTFSKFAVAGEAIAFTDAFEVPFEEVDNLTALAVMDDTLYPASAERIFAMQFDGPTDANTLSDVPTPSRVATDKGVIDQRSIVIMPQGMMYQSSVGIQLMSRGRAVNPEPAGSRVQDELELYPEITSAVLHPTGGFVTFAARNPTPVGDLFDGIRLVYDYTTDRWSRDTLLRNDTSVGDAPMSEVAHNGTLYTLTSATLTGEVYEEAPQSWLDDSSWVPMQVELAEVHPQGLQGHFGAKKWQLNAQRYTDHGLDLTWYMNYETSPFDSNLITYDRIASAPIEQFSEETNFQKCQSIRVVLRDVEPGPGSTIGTGRGASFVGLAVEIDPIDGSIYKLAAQEKS